jgi:hypothetical protein
LEIWKSGYRSATGNETRADGSTYGIVDHRLFGGETRVNVLSILAREASDEME